MVLLAFDCVLILVVDLFEICAVILAAELLIVLLYRIVMRVRRKQQQQQGDKDGAVLARQASSSTAAPAPLRGSSSLDALTAAGDAVEMAPAHFAQHDASAYGYAEEPTTEHAYAYEQEQQQEQQQTDETADSI